MEPFEIDSCTMFRGKHDSEQLITVVNRTPKEHFAKKLIVLSGAKRPIPPCTHCTHTFKCGTGSKSNLHANRTRVRQTKRYISYKLYLFVVVLYTVVVGLRTTSPNASKLCGWAGSPRFVGKYILVADTSRRAACVLLHPRLGVQSHGSKIVGTICNLFQYMLARAIYMLLGNKVNAKRFVQQFIDNVLDGCTNACLYKLLGCAQDKPAFHTENYPSL